MGFSGKQIAGISTAFVVAVGAIAAWRSFKIVPAQNYGVRIQMGKVINSHMEPDLYRKWPVMDNIYILKENTIIMDDVKVGKDKNTQDQNVLNAKMRLHYKNDPKSGVIAYHVADMAWDDGKNLLTGLMEQSFDSVAGFGRAVDSFNDPRKFLYALADNLQWRLNQNNVAIELDAFELLEMSVGDGMNPFRMPVQLRLKRNNDGKTWRIEDITGPSAAANTAAPAPAVKLN